MALALGLACAAQAAPRVALVIGNDRYPNLPPAEQLQRAVADATAVGRKLAAMGFKVIPLANADRRQMDEAMDQVAANLDPGGSVVVYFAGHGVQIAGGDYLLPVDAPSPNQASRRLLEKEAVALSSLFDDLKPLKAKTNVIILDACRENPYQDAAGRGTGGERGLERANPPQGFFVLYSAAENQAAKDRLPTGDRDPNSLYTRVLLKHLDDQVSLVDLAKRVQTEVAALAASAGVEQVPAYYDEILNTPGIAGEARSASQPAQAQTDPRAEELAYWTASNCAGGDLDGCRAYLAKFGAAARFADLAAPKLRPPPAVAATPVPDPDAAARAAIAGIPAADWSTRSGDQVLASVLARVNLAQIKALANTGDARAQTLVGLAFDWGKGGEAQDFAQAMTWYRKAADQGYAAAQFVIGVLYDFGQGVKQDYVQAMTWYRKAADQGDAEAQYNVGWLYHFGQGVKQDYAQAITWYRKAADQGDAEAQYNVGWLYHFGQGVKQDYAQAMTWYRKAADQGYAEAQYNIGWLYNFGHGVNQDYAQAMTWYGKAADQGYARAQLNIGVLYENGQGVKQDYAQAMTWFRKAADQGDATAQRYIGDFYAHGDGVPTDEAQARVWYTKAAAGGDEIAKTWLAGHGG